MAHWAEAYVGRPYIEGRFDCADLVVEVARERFGRIIRFPAHGAGVREWDAQIAALKDDFARPLGPRETPREGDGVLMRMTGRTRAPGHHIGLWCDVAGTPHVLHCLKRIGSCLHALGALERHGLEMMGVYRWL